MSKKQSRVISEYSKLRREFITKNPKCFICGKIATDIHHKSGRGQNTNKTETWMSVCRTCHELIHKNPKWAKENGYISKIGSDG